METKGKNILGEAGVIQLISGVVAIAICIGVIINGYGFLSGMESDNQVVLDMSHESYSVSLLGLMLFPFLLGIYGGIEIGRYIQTEFTKRRKKNEKT